MNDPVILDLRQRDGLVILLDEGVSCAPSVSGFKNLDTNYTLTINDNTYNVSNGGIVLEPTTKSLVINIGASDFPKGSYKGKLISDSRILGIYINIPITIKSYEADN